MFALLVAVSVVAQVDAPSPPPPPPVIAAPPEAAPPPPPAPRAKLLPKREPRVGAGVLVGRVATSVFFGGLGYGLGAMTSLGAAFGGFALGGSYLGIFVGPLLVVVASPLILGFGIFGVALGAAMFGQNFGRDFRDALKVAAIIVPATTAAAALVMLALLAVDPLLGLIIAPAVFFLAATISTPLFVQAFKPEPEELVRRDPHLGAGGLTIAF